MNRKALIILTAASTLLLAGLSTGCKKLEARDTEESAPGAPGGKSDLPPAAELVAEIEQFLRQQRPE